MVLYSVFLQAWANTLEVVLALNNVQPLHRKYMGVSKASYMHAYMAAMTFPCTQQIITAIFQLAISLSITRASDW